MTEQNPHYFLVKLAEGYITDPFTLNTGHLADAHYFPTITAAEVGMARVGQERGPSGGEIITFWGSRSVIPVRLIARPYGSV